MVLLDPLMPNVDSFGVIDEELATPVVACAEIKSRSSFATMAISAMIAGGPPLNRLGRNRSSHRSANHPAQQFFAA